MKLLGFISAFLLCGTVASAKYVTIVNNNKYLRVENTGDVTLDDQLICSLNGLDKGYPDTVKTVGSARIVGDNIYFFTTASTTGSHQKQGRAAVFRVNVSTRQCNMVFARAFEKAPLYDSGNFLVIQSGSDLIFWHKSKSYAVQVIHSQAPDSVETLYDAEVGGLGNLAGLHTVDGAPVFLMETVSNEGRRFVVYDKATLQIVGMSVFSTRMGLHDVRYMDGKLRMAFFVDWLNEVGAEFYVVDYKYSENKLDKIAHFPKGKNYDSSVVKITFSSFDDFFFITENQGPNVIALTTFSYNWKTNVSTEILSIPWPGFVGGVKLVNDSQFGIVNNNGRVNVVKFDSIGQFAKLALPSGMEYLLGPYALDPQNHRLLTYRNTTRALEVYEVDYSQNPMVLTNTYKLTPLRDSKGIKSVVLSGKMLYFYSTGSDRQTYIDWRELP